MSRLFFALWPDDSQREALAHAVRKPVRASGGRPVPLHNLHVTLAFLGSVPESQIPDVMALARRVADEIPQRALPIEVTLDRVEHWRKAEVLCALGKEAASASPEAPAAEARRATSATVLAEALKDETARVGFTPDLKPFRPHVTVARKVVRPARSLAMHSVSWSFTEFALVESRTDPSGPVYHVLESWPLS